MMNNIVPRLVAERDLLRKSFQEALETAASKEKECARLAEDCLGLEKRIQQLQCTEDSSKQSKAAIDYELAKIKVGLLQ